MSNPAYNRVKVTKNADTRRVTLEFERRSWHGVEDRSQITLTERVFEKALLDAQIIAPWNRGNA